ncbi:unnamed protein product [Heligmosomoides polygyrus]|uniref:Aldedh domain-containing protein n=1 Tax=Heligmosomoides polygyrus TaxID=6339 RepID=A0A183FFD4_HELPZ|nr:unnamed protein product [Heligmosomoides polygyrus]
MSIAQEEIVGPVMKAIRFDSMEDLLKKSPVIRDWRPIAVITQDADKAKHIANNIKSGSVWINPIDGASLAEFQLSETTPMAPRKAADGFKAFRSGRVIGAQSR